MQNIFWYRTFPLLICLLMIAQGCALRGHKPSNRRGRTVSTAPKAPTTPAQNSSYVNKAQEEIDTLRGKLAVAMGVLEEAEVQTNTFSKVPPGVLAKHLPMDAFRDAVKECWSSPPTRMPEAEKPTIDYKKVAREAERDNGLNELNETQMALGNLYGMVQACRPASLRKAQRFPRKSPKSSQALVNQKIEEIDAIRILMDRAPAMLEELEDALANTSQAIAILAMELSKDKSMSQEERSRTQEQLNQIIEVSLLELEVLLRSKTDEVSERLDALSEQVDDALFTRPFLGIR